MKVSNVKSQSKCSNVVISHCIHDECICRPIRMLTFLGKRSEVTEILGNKLGFIRGNFCVGSCAYHLSYLEILGHMMVSYQEVTQEMFQYLQNLSTEDSRVLAYDYFGTSFVRRLLYISNRRAGISREEICEIINRIIRHYVNVTSSYSDNYKDYIQFLNDGYVEKHHCLATTLFFEIKQEFSQIKFPLKPSINQTIISDSNATFMHLIQRSKIVYELTTGVYS